MKDYLAVFNKSESKAAQKVQKPVEGRPSKATEGVFEGSEGSAKESFGSFDSASPKKTQKIYTKLGSAGRPVPVRGLVMSLVCLWDNCNGWLDHKKGRRTLHQCSGCESWFELLPPEEPGLPVHDLAEEGATVSAMIN